MESVAKLSETGAGVRNVGAAFEALLKFIDGDSSGHAKRG